MELKKVHYAPSTYPASEEHCAGVSRRAGKIGAEYLQKLVRWIDNGITLVLVSRVRLRHGCGVTEPFVPLSLVLGERRPRMWSGCCLKPWTSVSRRSGFWPADDDEPDSLRATLLAMLRRRWGIAALRANARLLLERLAFVGRGGVLAMRRRVAGRARAWRGPRVWPLRF